MQVSDPIDASLGAVIDRYRRTFPNSGALYERALKVIPTGSTHDGRLIDPFPLYVSRAEGARKWDADDHEFIDFWMGHGALLLGHNHPRVIEAVTRQLAIGTHFGAAHELEIQWAEKVCGLIPSAEAIRFTMSGTEATMLALREARAYTGRDLVIRLAGHFHGWHDYAMLGWQYPFVEPSSGGVPDAVNDSVLVAEPDYLTSVERLIESHSRQVAAVILEPGGGSNGIIPSDRELLEGLRALCNQSGVVLIFDEVITGFRYSKGGAQAVYGVTPDITALGKALSGGLPGGAVAGRRDILSVHERPVPSGDGIRVRHSGTYNAYPLGAAAGLASLELIDESSVVEQAAQIGAELREALQHVLDSKGTPGVVVGQFSAFQILLGSQVKRGLETMDVRELLISRDVYGSALRRAMRLRGVDLMNAGGFTSIAHGPAEIEQTASALERCLREFPELSA